MRKLSRLYAKQARVGAAPQPPGGAQLRDFEALHPLTVALHDLTEAPKWYALQAVAFPAQCRHNDFKQG